MPILDNATLIQPIVDDLGKAYKDAVNIVDATRTDSNTPSVLVAIRLVRQDIFDAVSDIADNTNFDATLALANTIRAAEKNAITTANSMTTASARALEANIKIVTGNKFRKQFDGIDNNHTVTFSSDFQKLWYEANTELLCTQLLGYTSDGTAWVLSPSSPFPLSIADPRDSTVLVPANLEIRVTQLGANALVKITGDTASATAVTVSTAITAQANGAPTRYNVVSNNVAVAFKRITAITIRNAADSAAYNGANSDAFSLWVD